MLLLLFAAFISFFKLIFFLGDPNSKLCNSRSRCFLTSLSRLILFDGESSSKCFNSRLLCFLFSLFLLNLSISRCTLSYLDDICGALYFTGKYSFFLFWNYYGLWCAKRVSIFNWFRNNFWNCYGCHLF